MSAAATAAMITCLEEDRRRRQNIEPAVSLFDIMEVPWAMPVILLIEILGAAFLIWSVVK